MVDYLRLSITDRCNFNCRYCTPIQKGEYLRHEDVLRYEEMAQVVELFVKEGIRKVRITGGEPLIKKNILDLIKMLRSIKNLDEISLTTNGTNLKKMAPLLKESGVNRINISLDTLKSERFKSVTGSNTFENVWDGVLEAMDCGLSPVKLNVVPMKRINDDEFADFARLTLNYPLTVRFIEFFPTNKRALKNMEWMIPNKEVYKHLEKEFGPLEAVEKKKIKGNGPSEYYRLPDSLGNIGFISNETKDFCFGCSRVRMDCSGRISPCLFSGVIYDVKPLLRSGAPVELIQEDLMNVMAIKPFYTKKRQSQDDVEMSSLGG